MDRFGSVDPETRTLPGTWQAQVWRYFDRLLRNLERDQAELAAYRSNRLKALVRHAASTVPFYRRLYAGIDLRRFRGTDDITRLPTVTKSDLLAVGEDERLSARHSTERLIRVSTGGTTGQKLEVLLTPAYAQRRTAEAYRVLATNGYRPWDRIAVLSQRPVRHRWYHRLGLLRQSIVPVEWSVLEQQRKLAEERPAMLEGYPSRLHLLVDELELGYAPKAVLSHSETLAPVVRERIEQAFGAPVSNIYETWEFGRIAWEFPGSHGLVVAVDGHIVEILEGEVCVTDLNNHSMPLIRYRTGDRARLGEDEPDGLRRLEGLDGRISDYLEMPDGGPTPMLVVFQAVVHTRGVGAFQLRRRGRDAVTILIQAASDYSSRTETEIRDLFTRRFGFRDVLVERVGVLPRTESGKLSWLIDETLARPPP